MVSQKKNMVHSPDCDTDVFDLIARVYKRDVKVSKVGDRNLGQPEGSFFTSYYTEV